MKTHQVVFSPEAREQLLAIYRYIAQEASPDTAAAFAGSIIEHCEGLDTLPHRGTLREHLRPGLRIVGFRRRVTIAFTVEDDLVMILGVFYDGQDYEVALRDDELP